MFDQSFVKRVIYFEFVDSVQSRLFLTKSEQTEKGHLISCLREKRDIILLWNNLQTHISITKL